MHIERESTRLCISIGGACVADYVFHPDDEQRQSPRPYFDDLRTRGGVEVSQSHPDDHPWHRGLSLALPVVNDDNFWGGPSFLPGRGYVQLANNGTQQHGAFTIANGTEVGFASFDETLQWHTQSGENIVDERRSVTISGTDPRSWALTFSSTITNRSARTLSFGSPTTRGRPDAGYGGLFWRAPMQFADALIISPASDGGDEMRGQRAPWMGISGTDETSGPLATVVMVDGPRNLRTPPEWFARSAEYAGLCPGPFYSNEYDLNAGSRLSLDYAVVIADGVSDSDRGADLAETGRRALARAMTRSNPT